MFFCSTMAAVAGLGWVFYPWVPVAQGEQPVLERDAAEVTDVEIDLIVNTIREGDLLAIQEDMQGADGAWAEARRRGRGLWPVHEGLGDSLARFEKYDGALQEYFHAEQLLLDEDPGLRAPIVYKRAETLRMLGREEEALSSYLYLGELRRKLGRR